MNISRNRKKKLIVSYKNLSEELLELFKEAYPEGYKDYLQKTIKPNGEPIFVVPLETEEVSYMIKFDVKIDSGLVDDDLDSAMYGDDEVKDDDDFASFSEALDKDEDVQNHTERVLKHGSYDEMFENSKSDKNLKRAALDMTTEEIEAALDEEEEERDSYIDDSEAGDPDDDFEPSEDDLMNIDAELLSDESLTNPLLTEDNVDGKPAKKSMAKPRAKAEKSPKTSKSEKTTKPVKAQKPKSPAKAKK